MVAIAISAFSGYRSYLYVKQDLQVTASEVSYNTEASSLYMKIAFSNAGNRDAAVLRAEPTLWTRDADSKDDNSEEWIPLGKPVDPNIPVALPLDPSAAEGAAIKRKTYIGMRVSTTASDGGLYLLEYPVAQLLLDSQGYIEQATPVGTCTVNGFLGITMTPHGESQLQTNNTRPFVWAAKHYAVEAGRDAVDCRETPTNAPCPSAFIAGEPTGQK